MQDESKEGSSSFSVALIIPPREAAVFSLQHFVLSIPQ